MTDVIMLLIFTFEIFIGWRYPLVAVAIASQSYIIRNAFVASYDLEIVGNFQEEIWGILFPLAAYAILFLKIIEKKNLNIPKLVASDVILILLTIILIAGSIYSPDPYRGLEIAARFIALSLGYYILLRLYLTRHVLNHCVYVYFIGLWLISILASFIALLFQTEIDRRLTIGENHPIPFGMLIASGLLINVFFIARSEMVYRRVPRVFLFATFLLLLYVFIASNNRGPFIALVISVSFLLAFSIIRFSFVGINFRYIKQVMLLVMGISLIFVWILFINPDFIDRLLNGLTMLLKSGEEKGESALVRINAWDTALDLFVSHPIIGVGTGGFAHFHSIEYPHNLIYEIAAENGALGLLPLLFLIIISLWEIMLSARKKANPFAILAASLTLLNLLEAQVSYTLWMHKGWLISLALLIALNRSHDATSVKMVSLRR